jgi:hypothetical protein
MILGPGVKDICMEILLKMALQGSYKMVSGDFTRK